MLSLIVPASIVLSAFVAAMIPAGRRAYVIMAPLLVGATYYYVLSEKLKEQCGDDEALWKQGLFPHASPVAVALVSSMAALTDIQGPVLYSVTTLLVWLATMLSLNFGTKCLPGQ